MRHRLQHAHGHPLVAGGKAVDRTPVEQVLASLAGDPAVEHAAVGDAKLGREPLVCADVAVTAEVSLQIGIFSAQGRQRAQEHVRALARAVLSEEKHGAGSIRALRARRHLDSVVEDGHSRRIWEDSVEVLEPFLGKQNQLVGALERRDDSGAPLVSHRTELRVKLPLVHVDDDLLAGAARGLDKLELPREAVAERHVHVHDIAPADEPPEAQPRLCEDEGLMRLRTLGDCADVTDIALLGESRREQRGRDRGNPAHGVEARAEHDDSSFHAAPWTKTTPVSPGIPRPRLYSRGRGRSNSPPCDRNGSCCLPLVLPPHHAVHDARVALNDPHDLRSNVVLVVRHGNAVQALGLEGDGSADGVQEVALVDAGQGEAALVESLGALGRGTDTDCRERASDAREEGAFLGQGAGVGDDAERRALQLVVVVEAHGLVGAHQGVQLEARGLQAFAGAGVAAVEDGLSVLLG